MKLYFAAPLFCESELRFNTWLTNEIEAQGIEVFLPQRDGNAVNEEPVISMPVDERAKYIFNMDREHLLSTDVFLYVLDGRIPDEGAAVALGMAYMHKQSSKEKINLIGLHTDKRAAFMNEKQNPMIFASLDYIASSVEELLEYLSSL